MLSTTRSLVHSNNPNLFVLENEENYSSRAWIRKKNDGFITRQICRIYKRIHLISSWTDFIVEIVIEHPLELVEHTEKGEPESMELEGDAAISIE